MGRDGTYEAMPCLPHGCGAVRIKLFPMQHGSGCCLGRRWKARDGGRVPQRYGGPTTSCEHWAELGSHGRFVELLT